VGKVRYTRQAREDLLEIWARIASESPAAADRVYDQIEKRCRQLADFPKSGPARPDIGDGARSLTIERWLAFYRLVGGDAQVVRIVDGARDLAKLEWRPE
jgi:toxin ParE1/3/4